MLMTAGDGAPLMVQAHEFEAVDVRNFGHFLIKDIILTAPVLEFGNSSCRDKGLLWQENHPQAGFIPVIRMEISNDKLDGADRFMKPGEGAHTVREEFQDSRFTGNTGTVFEGDANGNEGSSFLLEFLHNSRSLFRGPGKLRHVVATPARALGLPSISSTA